MIKQNSDPDKYNFIPQDIRNAYHIDYQFVDHNIDQVRKRFLTYSTTQKQLATLKARRVRVLVNQESKTRAFAIESMANLDEALFLGVGHDPSLLSHHNITTRQDFVTVVSTHPDQVDGYLIRTHGNHFRRHHLHAMVLGDQLVDATMFTSILRPYKQHLQFIGFESCLLGRTDLTDEGGCSSFCQEVAKLNPGLAVSGMHSSGSTGNTSSYHVDHHQSNGPLRIHFLDSQREDYSTYHIRRQDYRYDCEQMIHDTISLINRSTDHPQDLAKDRLNNLINNSDLTVEALATIFCQHLYENNTQIIALFAQSQPFTVILRYALNNRLIDRTQLHQDTAQMIEDWRCQFFLFSHWRADDLPYMLTRTYAKHIQTHTMSTIKYSDRLFEDIADEIRAGSFKVETDIAHIIAIIQEGIAHLDSGCKFFDQFCQARSVCMLLKSLLLPNKQLPKQHLLPIIEAIIALELPQQRLQQGLLAASIDEEDYPDIDNLINLIAVDVDQIDYDFLSNIPLQSARSVDPLIASSNNQGAQAKPLRYLTVLWVGLSYIFSPIGWLLRCFLPQSN